MAGKSRGSRSGGGARKQSTQRVSRIASRGLRGDKLTKGEVKSLSGSVLSQDEHKGPRKR